jgi:putative endonuclease
MPDKVNHTNPAEPLWHLYMIRLENGHLYTGITTDVERRFNEHQSGKGAKFLRGKGSMTLAFSTPIGDRSSALKCEAQIKKMPKREKEQIVNGSICLP